jgi:hypothetical protein
MNGGVSGDSLNCCEALSDEGAAKVAIAGRRRSLKVAAAPFRL